MTIPGLDSAQHAYDNAEPDNEVCEGCEDNGCDLCDGDCCNEDSDNHGYEEDPDDARDRAYAYGDEG